MGFQLFRTGILLVFIISTALCDYRIFGSDHIPTIQVGPNGEIRSISGDLEDSVEEPGYTGKRPNVNRDTYPVHRWADHVDFDELHPGEDNEAVESRVPTIGEFPRAFAPEFADEYESPESMPMPKPRPLPPRTDRSNTNRNNFPTLNFPGFFNSNTGMDENPLFSPFFGRNPWWKGPNVCQKKSEEDGPTDGNEDAEIEDEPGNENENGMRGFHMKFSACEEKETKHTCTTHLLGPNINRTIRTDYECCHGYLKNSVTNKCERGTLKPIIETLSEVGGKEFTRLVKNVGLDAKLETENLTVFVPTDDAITKYMSAKKIESNEVAVSLAEREIESIRRRRSILMHSTANDELGPRTKRRTPPLVAKPMTVTRISDTEEDTNSIGEHDWRANALDQQDAWRQAHGRQITYSHQDNNRELQKTLLGHMISGKISTDDFVDEKVLYTENKEGSVRMNTWTVGAEKLKTLNCARLTSINHQCSNGIIHMVDRVIEPATKTIADVIATNPDLTMLQSFMSSSGLITKLTDSKEHITLFAPTNAAFSKLNPAILQKLRNNDPCLPRIMRNHLLPITLCSTVVYQKGQVRNINEGLLGVERSADDKIFVNGTELIVRDVITTNGVIHILDGVLMSDDDKPLVAAMERAQLTSFLELLSEVGLKSAMDKLQNVTIFAPSNDAIAALPQEVRRDRARLRDILSYHIATPETRVCHFKNGQELSTRLSRQVIRINLQNPMFPIQVEADVTAQCGRILKQTSACNGIVYEVDRVLIPSDLDAVQTLQTQPDLAVFTRLIQETNLTGILQGEGPMTIFAPKDSAFYALPKEDFERILNNKDETLKVLRKHIVSKESLCCAGIPSNMFFLTKRIETLSGERVPVYRDVRGQAMFGNAKVTVCDLTASNNAVIHTIDSLLDTGKDEDIENSNEFMGTCLPKADDVRMMFFSF